MTSYRLRNILIAVALAVVAALLTGFYVSNYKQSVASEQEAVPVLVAARDIQAGTLGSQVVDGKMLKKQEVARKEVVTGAITDVSQVKGLIATQSIYIGEQVTARRFGPLTEAGVRTQLKGTYRAMRFKGDPSQILSGVIRAGDHVDVVANIRFPSEQSDKHFARVILRDVLVLRTSGAGENPGGLASPTDEDGWVMLRLTDSQSQKMFFAYAEDNRDDWSLSLRPGLRDANSPNSIEDAVSILRAGLTSDRAKSRLSEGR